MSVPEKTLVTAPPATARRGASGSGRRTLIAALVVAALIVIVVVVATGALGGGGSSPGTADNAVATGVARIEERSLSSQTQVSATLGYADPTTIVVPAGTAPSNLQQAQQTVATDRGDAAERAGHARLRHRDAGPAAGRLGGGAGEGSGRLPGEQRGREPSGRRRRGRRRLRIDAVRKRRADGGDRRAERDAGCGQGRGRPEPGLVCATRARRRPERACGGRVVRVCLRSELGLHCSAARSGRS